MVFSINEALDMGIEVDSVLLDAGIDKDLDSSLFKNYFIKRSIHYKQ